MIDTETEVSFSTPAVDNGRIYYFSNGNAWSYGRIYCHDAKSGEIIWDKKTEDCYTFSSPAISSDDKLFIGAFSPINGKNKILCYDISDGNFLWEYILDGIASVDSSPAIANNRVYIASGTGEIYAFQDAFEIKEITGGFASVKANIVNIWNDDLYDVDWTLSVSGGLFGMINITVNERIEVLEAETTDIVRAFPIIGFGDITITLTVNIANCGTRTITKQGSVYGFFVKV
jgi:outer membrane protein assembly factor BamB